MPVQRQTPLLIRQRLELRGHQNVVKHSSNSADTEAEHQALDVESGLERQIEQARRAPVFRHEQGLGESKRRGENARPQHGATVGREGDPEQQPWQEEGPGPDDPHVLFVNHQRIPRSASGMQAIRPTSHPYWGSCFPAVVIPATTLAPLRQQTVSRLQFTRRPPQLYGLVIFPRAVSKLRNCLLCCWSKRIRHFARISTRGLIRCIILAGRRRPVWVSLRRC